MVWVDFYDAARLGQLGRNQAAVTVFIYGQHGDAVAAMENRVFRRKIGQGESLDIGGAA